MTPADTAPGTPGTTQQPGLLIHAAGTPDENGLLAILRSAANANAALPSGRPIEVLDRTKEQQATS